MDKDELLEKLKTVGITQGHNSMGVQERYYNPYYLVKTCFETEVLEAMSENELQSLIKLAEYATEIFY